MTLIFDGLLDVYSTCRDCGQLMKVIHTEEHSHPGCVTVQTELESLADLWNAETRDLRTEEAAYTDELIAKVRAVEIGEAAVTYAEQGWPVFPLATHSKVPAIKGGKGFKDATNNPERIKRWWTRHPTHNIGLATGHLFDVVDVDTKDKDGKPSPAGIMSLIGLLREGARLPDCHGVAITASGGLHLYVRRTGKGNYGAMFPGIDYRGLGGYVVGPPSLLGPPGRDYTWLVEPSPTIKGE